MIKSTMFIAGCLAGQLIAYAAVELTPKPAQAAPQCEQPAEVLHVMNVMASMPLAITVTETGTPPDAIGALIGDL